MNYSSVLTRICRWSLAGFLWLLLSPLVLAASEGEPEQEGEVMRWADETVDQVTDYVGYGVDWFDGFFDDPRYIDEAHARFHLRWRNDFTYTQDERSLDYKTRVSARVDLPQFNNRLKLLIFADDDEYFTNLASSGSVIKPDAGDDKTNGIGLRYDLLDTVVEHLSFSASMRLDPVTFIARVRHRSSWQLQDDLGARLTTTGYWNSKEGFGVKLQSDLEKLLTDTTLLRWTNTGIWDEEHHQEAVRWSSQLTHYRKISDKRAIAYSVGVNGHTRPHNEVENIALRLRYRQNILRPWLFVELSPEVYWPQDERRDDCTTCLAVLARVEVVFSKWD